MVTIGIVLWALVAAAVLFWVRASLIEPRRLCVREVTVPLAYLPEQRAGLRVAHLSDLHGSGQRGAEAFPRQAVAAALQQEPDLILITGDLASGSENMACAADQLAELTAEYGVYAVLGNHDWDCTLGNDLFSRPGPPPGRAQWAEALRSTPIKLLTNTSRTLTVRGRTIAIVGIGDPSCGRDDLPTALRYADCADLKILLAHSPDAIDLPGADWADLLLAGHTHGGQCRLPGLGSIWAPVWRLRQRSVGLMRFGQTVVHVSQGIGAGVDARFLCPPEVYILTLVPGSVEQIPVTPRYTDQARPTEATDEGGSYGPVD